LDHHHAALLGGFVNSEIALNMLQLKDLQVLILGLGESGLAMARWCVMHGAQITVADTRQELALLSQLKQDCPQAQFVSGPLNQELIEGKSIRAVFKSPGLTPADVSGVWNAAEQIGLWMGTELTLFQQALDDLQQSQQYTPQILAITGTNGKTTVTSLTGQLLERAGKKVAVAGNIGPTLLDTLRITLEDLPQVWVLELSSFQLNDIKQFKPTIATILNITQDHLDWHGDMASYVRAKSKIMGTHATLVLPVDDELVMKLLPTEEQIKKKQKTVRHWIGYGADVPKRAGDYGLETVNGVTWLVRAHEADETRKRRRNEEEEEIYIQRLMPADALRIRGQHNALNALAVLALACNTGAALGPMLFGLREYLGEPHRLESIAVIKDVEYFEDSKGTNVGATVAAIQGLGVDRRLVVILGGDGKGQDFSPLSSQISRYARAVVLIGRDASLIQEACSPTSVNMQHASSMQEAVEMASQLAQTGDAVVMSPACASFDMFDNYAHRAKVFCDAVHALALAEGTA
jgi:UDP-N-acetylmuramoylalanine--D-glutamate ligase